MDGFGKVGLDWCAGERKRERKGEEGDKWAVGGGAGGRFLDKISLENQKVRVWGEERRFWIGPDKAKNGGEIRDKSKQAGTTDGELPQEGRREEKRE